MIGIFAIVGLVVLASAAPNSNYVRKINDKIRPKPIVLGHGGYNDMKTGGTNRNAIFRKFNRWPNGVIPYVFGTDYGTLQSNITDAMSSISANTCITFVARSNETDYINIVAGNGECTSVPGHQGTGAQAVTLSHSDTGTCLTRSTIVHELMHAIGLDHEHNRADRANFVTVHMDLVMTTPINQTHNYNIVDPSRFYDYGCPYNYMSVMHYDKTSFAATPGTIVMETTDPTFSDKIGHVPDAHPNDYEKINRIYQCTSTVTVAGQTCGTITAPNCVDDPNNLAYCDQVWKKGQCNNSPTNILTCPFTCNGCVGGSPRPPPPCQDDPNNQAYCDQIWQRGQCSNSPSNAQTCPYSCNACLDGTAGRPAPPCQDDPNNIAYCAQVGQNNQCQNDPNNLVLCRKTCGVCT